MNKIRKKNSWSTSATDAEKLSHLSFASLTFRFISSLVAQNTTSVLGRKNTNADSISFQPPNQIICKSVLVFLCEVFRARRRMFSGFPVSTFWFYKIYPLSPSFLPFRFIFTVKWYGMQQYPFLFTSNIAKVENNTFLRHCFGPHKLWSKVTTREAHSELLASYWCPGFTSQTTLDPFPFGKFFGSVMGFRIAIFRHFENS